MKFDYVNQIPSSIGFYNQSKSVIHSIQVDQNSSPNNGLYFRQLHNGSQQYTPMFMSSDDQNIYVGYKIRINQFNQSFDNPTDVLSKYEIDRLLTNLQSVLESQISTKLTSSSPSLTTPLNMNNNKVTSVQLGTQLSDAANLQNLSNSMSSLYQAVGENFIPLTGGLPSDLYAGGYQIKGMGIATSDFDAAQYGQVRNEFMTIFNPQWQGDMYCNSGRIHNTIPSSYSQFPSSPATTSQLYFGL